MIWWSRAGSPPARAGRTIPNPESTESRWDHPRSRGKDPPMDRMNAMLSGSPPLARERLFPCNGEFHKIRITPARAGKTFQVPISSHGLRGSPPLARERHAVHLTVPGSPPLARERRIIPIRRDPVSGITPARAGKTIIQGEMTLFDRDHPRSRGKDFKVFSPSSDELGSPPLARERLRPRPIAPVVVGITPARAGKTNYRPIQSL